MMCDMMNDLISIIVPVYRVESYLTACVESVLAQTYEHFELILVDDGSPDNCPRMCDEFAAQDSRIRVIHKENGGLSSARNAGIDAAKGEYLAFLDSDDLWTPVFLERLYRAIGETGAELAVCLFRRFRGDPPMELPEAVPTELLTRREAFECFFNLRNENMVVAPNKLYRRELFAALRYPLGQIHEDEAVIHEIIGGTKTVAWVEEAHYLYREAPNSITTAAFSLKRLDAARSKERRIAWFESRGMQDLADRTRITYLSNLMWLYRMVLMESDAPNAREICRKLYDRFCEIYSPELIKSQSSKAKLRYWLFRAIPVIFSYLDCKRLKRKGII